MSYVIQTFRFDGEEAKLSEESKALFDSPIQAKPFAITQQRSWELLNDIEFSYFTIVCEKDADTTIEAFINKDETIFDADKATEKFDSLFN